MSAPKITMIAAVARNGVIGAGGKLPWHIPEELAHFRQRVTGSTIIVGRKTFETLPDRLDVKKVLVVTRSTDRFYAETTRKFLRIKASPVLLGNAIMIATAFSIRNSIDQIFVVGGEQIYEALLPDVDDVEISRIDLAPPGDAHFPRMDVHGMLSTFHPSPRVSLKTAAGETYYEARLHRWIGVEHYIRRKARS